jgi:peptidoglycan/xylan/chitin deacetylase (PgdA/CDA1 family)
MLILCKSSLLKPYYRIKPLIPRNLQLLLRRSLVAWTRKWYADTWPIDNEASRKPENWSGWPDNKQFALVLTHDVDTAKGQDKCLRLLELEKERSFCSSFNFVPRRYNVSPELRQTLVDEGFEVGVHGLYHDGKYFESREIFCRRANLINGYLKDWGAVGFRSPSMLHNLDWIGDLDIEYDASTFDTDPFEPQSDGVRSIFPFHVEYANGRGKYVELPYTLPQDFTVFVLMKEKNIDIWKKKLDWICEKGGMALINTHPDYMNFNGTKLAREEYPARLYAEFLEYAASRYKGRYWHALPKDVARFFRSSSGMRKGFDREGKGQAC